VYNTNRNNDKGTILIETMIRVYNTNRNNDKGTILIETMIRVYNTMDNAILQMFYFPYSLTWAGF